MAKRPPKQPFFDIPFVTTNPFPFIDIPFVTTNPFPQMDIPFVTTNPWPWPMPKE